MIKGNEEFLFSFSDATLDILQAELKKGNPKSTQPCILSRSIIWVPGTSGDLVVKNKHSS